MIRLALMLSLAILLPSSHMPINPQSQDRAEPISKAGLLDALELGLNKDELPVVIREIKKRHVSFQITDEVEREIRAAGKSLTKRRLTALIKVLRESYTSSQSAQKQDQPDFPILEVHWVSESVPSPRPELPFGLRVTLQTTVKLENSHFIVECDGPIGRAELASAVPGLQEFTFRHGLLNPNTWEVFIQKPSLTPQQPLLILIYSTTRIKVVRIGGSK